MSELLVMTTLILSQRQILTSMYPELFPFSSMKYLQFIIINKKCSVYQVAVVVCYTLTSYVADLVLQDRDCSSQKSWLLT